MSKVISYNCNKLEEIMYRMTGFRKEQEGLSCGIGFRKRKIGKFIEKTMKIIGEIFGRFKSFLYLCIVNGNEGIKGHED